MGRSRLLLLLPLLLVGVAGVSHAQLGVRPAGPMALTARGRQVLTVVLAVENNDGVDRDLLLDVIAPPEWARLAPEDAFRLEAGGRDTRLVGILVPSQAVAGTYPLVCRLRDRMDPQIEARTIVQLVVVAAPDMQLLRVESPQLVTAGESYEALFSVRNTGNTPLRVDLDIRSDPPFPFVILRGPTVLGFEMPPGDQKDLSVLVQTDPRLPEAVRHTLAVTARGRDTLTVPERSVTNRVEVIPVATSGRLDEMHTLPAVLTTAGTAAQTGELRGRLQTSLDASGTLDEAGKHQLELHLHKELASDEEILINGNDRYRLAYRNPWLELDLGDTRYTLSPLLAIEKSGRGALGALRLGPLRAAGLYYQDVWQEGGARTAAGTLDLSVRGDPSEQAAEYRAAVNVLTDLEGTATYGLWQQVRQTDALGLQVDAALQTGTGGRISPALYVLADGEGDAVFFQARFVGAWAGFQGSYMDTQSLSASGGVRLLERNLSLYGSYGLWGPGLFTEPLTSMDRNRRITIGIRGAIPALGTEISAEGEDVRHTESLAPATTYRDRALRLRGRQRLGVWALNLSTVLEQPLEPEAGHIIFDYRIGLDFKPAGALGASTSLEWDGRMDPAGILRYDLRAAANLNGTWRATRIGLHAGAHYIQSEPGRSSVRGEAELVFSHTFPRGHVLAVAGKLAADNLGLAWEPGYEARVSLATPLEIPVSRRTPAAVVRGRLYRVETGQPMIGSIVRLGSRATSTDSRGEFVFNLPSAGSYYLSVDRSRLGFALIPSQPDPILVDATRRESRIEIGIVRAAALSGNVGVFGFLEETDVFVDPETASDPVPIRRRGLSGATIELSNGSDRRRALTNANGDFSFAELRPGHYTLRLADGQIPAYHRVEPTSLEIDLEPASREVLLIRVVQERRRIRILEPEATIEIENP